MSIPIVPASYFGIVLGIAGLGGAWRVAHRIWALPGIIGELLMLVATIVWAALVILYSAKWEVARSTAVAELEYPVQCCFVGLVAVATSLVAIAAAPYSAALSLVLFIAGAFGSLAFALWRTGLLWRGERDDGATTPVLYLPAVAGGFVTATAAEQLGFADWGQLAFGAGLFSWVAIESVILRRLYNSATMPAPLRPSLGIQLAPPTVGAVAYLSIAGGVPDTFAHALVGYGLLQALLILRMLPWILEEPFAPSYWAFTFGATALATAPMLISERMPNGALATAAPYLFAAANLIVGVIAVLTLSLVTKSWLLRTTSLDTA